MALGLNCVKLILRLFVKCNRLDAAHEVSTLVLRALTEFSPQITKGPARYWKDPELFELSAELVPENELSFSAVISKASHGWQHMASSGDRSSVWNPVGDFVFLAKEVVWAEVQLFDIKGQ